MKNILIAAIILINCSVLFSQDWMNIYKPDIIKNGSGYSSNDQSTAVYEDNIGNAIHTGYFEGVMIFGEDTLISSGARDLFVAKFNKNGYWDWAVSAGGSLSEYGKDVTVNSGGDIFITGYFTGNVKFGFYQLIGSINTEIFVAKLNSNGVWQWAVAGTVGGFDRGNGITSDNSGNCYVAGSFEGNLNFGSQQLTSSGLKDIFVAKISGSGNVIWVAKGGSTSTDDAASIKYSGSSNSLMIAGYIGGNSVFGSKNVSTVGSKDLLVAKIDTTGTWIWAVSAGSTSSEELFSIDVDGSGNAVVAGIYIKSFLIGNTTLQATTNRDILVAKINNAGVWSWAATANGAGLDNAYSIGLDGSGNSYITGSYEQDLSFGTYAINVLNGRNGFIAKLNSSGTWQWVKSLDGTTSVDCFSIAVMSNGLSYVTGQFYDKMIKDIDTLKSAGENDIFIGRLTSGGVWNYIFANSGIKGLSKVIAAEKDKNGDIILAGYFYGTIVFGNDTIISNGNSDGFIAKFRLDSGFVWAVNFGGANYDELRAVCVDSTNNLLVAGLSQSSFSVNNSQITNKGLSDIIYARVTKDGEIVWAKSIGDRNDDKCNSCEYMHPNNFILAGNFQEKPQFGAVQLSSTGFDDIFVTRIDNSGDIVWAVKAGGNQYDDVEDIALNSTGFIHLTGSFESNSSFGSTNLSSAGGDDIYVAKLNSTGVWQWVVSAGTSNLIEYGKTIKCDNLGNLYFAGTFKGVIELSGSFLISNGDNDIIIGKINPNGNWIWAKSFGSSTSDIAKSIEINKNELYLAGFLTSNLSYNSVNLYKTADRNSFFAKFDTTGIISWAKSDSGAIFSEPVSIIYYGNNLQYLTGNFTGNIKFGKNSKNELYSIDENIFLSSYGKEPPKLTWTINENTGKNSTIIIKKDINPFIDGRPLEKGDAVGVFYLRNSNFYCAGYGIWDDNNLAITVWGDNSQTLLKDGFFDNETYNFKTWNQYNGNENVVDVRYESGPSYFNDGAVSVISRFPNYYDTLNINLNMGWNLVSSNIQPAKPLMDSIFKSYQNDVVIVKNGKGSVFIPSFNINTIGNWNLVEAYQIYANKSGTFKIFGEPILPETIPVNLTAGWNLTAYLRNTSISIEDGLNSLVQNGSLVIAKNSTGNVYIPSFGINTIGNMLPTAGYQLYLNNAATLLYPPNNLIEKNSSSVSFNNYSSTNYFPRVNYNSLNNSTYIINSSKLPDYSEIAVYNKNDKLLGAGRIINGKSVVTVWGNDEWFENDLISDNEEMKMMIYNQNTKHKYQISSINLFDYLSSNYSHNYKTNSIAIINLDDKSNLNSIIYPNPAKDIINLQNFYDSVNYEIYDNAGKLVLTGSTSNNQININSLPAATYILKVISNNTVFTEEFVKIK